METIKGKKRKLKDFKWRRFQWGESEDLRNKNELI